MFSFQSPCFGRRAIALVNGLIISRFFKNKIHTILLPHFTNLKPTYLFSLNDLPQINYIIKTGFCQIHLNWDKKWNRSLFAFLKSSDFPWRWNIINDFSLESIRNLSGRTIFACIVARDKIINWVSSMTRTLYI